MSVKEQDLLDVVNRLNKRIGCTHMSKDSYYISRSYGGYALHKGFKDSSGIQDISGGHMTRAYLLAFLQGFEKGLNV